MCSVSESFGTTNLWRSHAFQGLCGLCFFSQTDRMPLVPPTAQWCRWFHVYRRHFWSSTKLDSLSSFEISSGVIARMWLEMWPPRLTRVVLRNLPIEPQSGYVICWIPRCNFTVGLSMPKTIYYPWWLMMTNIRCTIRTMNSDANYLEEAQDKFGVPLEKKYRRFSSIIESPSTKLL